MRSLDSPNERQSSHTRCKPPRLPFPLGSFNLECFKRNELPPGPRPFWCIIRIPSPQRDTPIVRASREDAVTEIFSFQERERGDGWVDR